MTSLIGIRPPGGVPALAVSVSVAAVSVAFVAVADPAAAERADRVAGAAAFERAGRVAGVFAGVARLLSVLIRSNVSGGGARRESPGDLPRLDWPDVFRERADEIANVPLASMCVSADGPWWNVHRLR
jgi:hypothetical protein